MKLIISLLSIIIILSISHISTVQSIEIKKEIDSLVNEKISVPILSQRFSQDKDDNLINLIFAVCLIVYFIVFTYLFSFINSQLDNIGISILGSLFLAFPLSIVTFLTGFIALVVLFVYLIFHLYSFIQNPIDYISNLIHKITKFLIDDIIPLLRSILWISISSIIQFFTDLFPFFYKSRVTQRHL